MVSKQSERERLRKLMARKSAAQRDLTIDYSRQKPRRRAKYRNDPIGFCLTYFPKIFYNPFTADQLETIDDMVKLIKYGGCYAIAAPRGDGKSTRGKAILGVWAIAYGHLKWLAVIEANTTEADGTLDDIKSYYEVPESPDLFGDDFPEICQPVRALEGNAQRQRGQTVGGERTRIKWASDQLVFPTVKGSKASGARITPRGAEKPIRGLARKNMRPDFVLLNDVETDDTARSFLQTATIRRNIERGIMGLAGPGQKIGIMMLCTILSRRCLAAQFTDRQKSPAWNGRRYRLITRWPEHKDMWDQYMYLQVKDMQAGLNPTVADYEYYLKHRKEMDAGVVVSNPYRFIQDARPDGMSLELSTIQHCYNEIVRMGSIDNFKCEYQNEPPDDMFESSRLEQDMIFEKVNGSPKGVVPSWCEKLTCFIDVHDQKLFWSAVAWKAGGVGYVVDYGVNPVHSPIPGSVTKEEKTEQVDKAIFRALAEFVEWEKTSGWGRRVDRGLIDSAYKSPVVYSFCNQFVDGLWRPARGYSNGISGKFPRPHAKEGIRKIGAGFYESWMESGRAWVWILDADKYKQQIQNGFKVIGVDDSGSLSLFGSEPVQHRAFAEQICSEVWIPDELRFVAADGSRKPSNNHWLDCVAGCCAAADMLGIRVIGTLKYHPPKKQEEKKEKQVIKPVRNISLRTRY